jgi:hypothetical protein
LLAACFLLALAVLAWLLRYDVTPLAWDRAEGSRALILDRWTGDTWLVQKQGVRQTFRLTP